MVWHAIDYALANDCQCYSDTLQKTGNQLFRPQGILRCSTPARTSSRTPRKFPPASFQQLREIGTLIIVFNIAVEHGGVFSIKTCSGLHIAHLYVIRVVGRPGPDVMLIPSACLQRRDDC